MLALIYFMIYLSDATYTVKNSKEETIIPTPTRKINFSIQQPFYARQTNYLSAIEPTNVPKTRLERNPAIKSSSI